MNRNIETEALRQYLTPKEILVIEDDAGVCRMLESWSQRMNCRLSFAANGPDGLAKALAQDWHFVLVDIGLPTMDGFEVIQRIRAKKPDFVRFAAVSGLWTTDRVERLKDLGCFVFVTKPTDFTGQLLENLWVMLGVGFRDSPPEPHQSPISRPLPATKLR